MSSTRLYFSDKPVGIDITDENEIANCSERIFGFSDISDKTARLKAAFESVSSDRADVIVRAVPDICGVAEIHAYNGTDPVCPGFRRSRCGREDFRGFYRFGHAARFFRLEYAVNQADILKTGASRGNPILKYANNWSRAKSAFFRRVLTGGRA